jgi:hypothetical protein
MCFSRLIDEFLSLNKREVLGSLKRGTPDTHSPPLLKLAKCGRFGKGMSFSTVSVTLEHDTPYSSFESGLGNPFVSHSICYKFIPCVVFESMLPNHWSCHSYVQEKSI